MTVSVAIATYNRAAMVQQAVAAALAQSLAPFEVVVSDDASTDQTAEKLEHWLANQEAAARDSVRVLRHPVNSKGVVNWNQAIEATSGEYIAWCSDDDRFLPGHLAESVAYLEANPDVGLVHSGFVDALEDGADSLQEVRPLRSSQPLVIGREQLLGYLIRYYDWPFHPSTIVMRRAVWQQVGQFDPRYALADTDWFVRAAMQVPVALLPRHGVLNRRHPGNWSNQVGSAGMQREIYRIVDQAIQQIWQASVVRRTLWRMLWRTNVRARLALTIRARLRSGDEDAALLGWRALVNATKADATKADSANPAPSWFVRWGAALIRRVIRHKARKRNGAQPRRDELSGLRKNVSPR